MDIDSAKENIQPLACGRNISVLQVALSGQHQDELLIRRRDYEEKIRTYSGDDPLELWLEYIGWIEQAFPRSGKDSELQDVLQRCLQLFEHDDKYKQDRRMVKTYIKFIDSQPIGKCHEYFCFLFNQGIGTMVADLYLGWAYYFESVGSFAKAGEIYQMGLGARAQPIELLKRSLTQLQIVIAGQVRCSSEDEYNSMLMAHMGERRLALTSLHGQSVKQVVGSLRTDAAVKSITPGIIPQANSILQETPSNVYPMVSVMPDQEGGARDGFAMGEIAAAASSMSVASQIKSVVESALKAQENIKEPGPWTKLATEGQGVTIPGQKKKGSLFSKKEIAKNTLGFEICEDSEESTSHVEEEDVVPEEEKSIRVPTSEPDLTAPKINLPIDFVRRNLPQDDFLVPLVPQLPEEYSPPNTAAMYIKNLVFPEGLHKEFSFEEIRAYRRLKMCQVPGQETRKERVLTEMESFMERINLPKDFVRKNRTQTPFNPEYYPFEGTSALVAMCQVLSIPGCHQSYEELRKERYLERKRKEKEISEKMKQNQTPPADVSIQIMEDSDMEMDVEVSVPVKKQPVVVPVDVYNSGNINNNFDYRQSASPPPPPGPASEDVSPFNETCSTQMFNLFIKAQSISTPTRGGNNKDQGGSRTSSVPRSSLSLYKNGQQQLQQPLMLRDDVILESSMEENMSSAGKGTTSNAQENVRTGGHYQPQHHQQMLNPQQNTSPEMIHYNGKQLSVIMETTESSASSGGCQTTNTDATITKSSGGETRFGHSTQHSTIDYGVLSLTAKPRKSILKIRPVEEDSPPAEEVIPAPEQFTIFTDENEFDDNNQVGDKKKQSSSAAMTVVQTVKKDEDSFLVPQIPIQAARSNNVSVFRESMDFFAAPPPPVPRVPSAEDGGMASNFAMPLPPKPKAYLPLYNDSMEHFMEKAKTVPRIPIKEDQEEEEVMGFFGVTTTQIPEMPDLPEASMKVPDFSIFQDSIMGVGEKSMAYKGAVPKERSLHLGHLSYKENNMPIPSPDVSLSPLKSFMSSQKPQQSNMDDSMSFLESPKKNGGGISGRSNNGTESTMPTIAAIDPMLLENSMTFPSMKDITAHTTTAMHKFNLTAGINHKDTQLQNSIFAKPPGLMMGMDESMTFNTLMKKESGSKPKVTVMEDANRSILDLMAECDEPLMPLPPPPAAMDASMTFNSLMRKEAGKGMTNTGAIEVGVENLNLITSEPTTTIKIPKLSFNSLMREDEEQGLFAKPMAAVGSANPDQSSFPMELPSSTAHGFSIFTKSSTQKVMGFTHNDRSMHMEKSISPIPSMRPEDVEAEELLEGEEDAQEDIYKFENTLRVLPEVEEPDPDSWYNDHLDVSREEQQKKGKGIAIVAETAERPKIGDRDYVDPFDPDLINTFLAQVDFVNYVHNMNECDMREKIPPLRQGGHLEICDQVFSVRKLIGKGAFGQIYSAKTSNDRLVALKQSRPCNLWEYYICMEVRCRMKELNEDLLPALVDIEYGLVAKNASVFVLPFCQYGNLINVCNEVKKETGRNLNEKVVMVLVTQILTIIDALHGCQIIHADIKPDNFMLMGPIDQDNFYRPILKLIDFGQAIDMQLHEPNVEFHSSLATEGFTCSEMLENRPWTYQTDLFCVAGTIHTLLLGKYMTVQKGVCGYATAKLPRYLQKGIWDAIFDHLLNVPDCKTMPNLQEMKLSLKQHLMDNEGPALDEVKKFNGIVGRVQVLDK